MSKKPMIVFEGIEGSGKSYHVSRISKYLKKKKIDHIRIREPGGSKNAEKIRKLILNRKTKFNKDTDLLLYLAARSENLVLLKKNYKKKIILIDRFIDSTIAYQHYGFGIDLRLINLINNKLIIKKPIFLNNYIDTENSNNENIFLCYSLNDAKPKRDKNNKWYVSKVDYADESYPEYCCGWAYVTNVVTMKNQQR